MTDRQIYSDEVYVEMGTLAFSLESERLFIRGCDGWRLITNAGKKAILQFSAHRGQKDAEEQLIRYRAQKKVHLIALNEPYTGDMKGIHGADKKCQQQAAAAKFPHPRGFRALLQSTERNINVAVHPEDHDAPVVNLRGQLIYRSFSELLAKEPAYNVPIVSFEQKDTLQDSSTWPAATIWHGSGGANCEDWTSEGHEHKGVGSSFENGSLIMGKEHKCSKKHVVLCIEEANHKSVARRLRKRRRLL